MAKSIIALVGVAMVTVGASLLPVQSADATTTSMGEGQKAASSTTAAANNNVSITVLGSLFSIGKIN